MPEATELAPEIMRPEQGGRYPNVGRTRFYELLASGEVPSFRTDASRWIRKPDLDDFVERRLTEVFSSSLTGVGGGGGANGAEAHV